MLLNRKKATLARFLSLIMILFQHIKLMVNYSNLQEKDETVYADTIESLISRVQIPIKAVLGNSSISVDDFINLQVGDIIRLDREVDSDLNVYVGNIKKFTALPGATGNNYAVRITSVIREEQ